MCGIYGFSTKQTLDNKSDILRKIGIKNRLRGPNHSGKYLTNDIALGIERLSILDIDKGNQPIFSNNKKFIIVHNGEIYNYLELRNDLEKSGYIFYTDTDTEVIVNLYQHIGLSLLPLLNGMFSFCIYEIETKKLVICRDRFGIKPLHYFYNHSDIIFSSQLDGILKHPLVENNISADSIDLFLTMDFIPAPYTIYKNIKKLEHGHYLIWSNKKLKIKKWYEFSYNPKIYLKCEKEYIEKLDNLIDNAVKLRMRSDMPIGAFLSGGLDSSLITSYMSKYHKSPLKTYNISFNDQSFNEGDYAFLVSEFIDTDHYSEFFDNKKMLEILPEIWSLMDEPFSDASLLPTFFLSKITSKEVSVALSGDGGDEIFAGYPTYLGHKIANQIPQLIIPFIKLLVNKLPTNYDNISLDFKLKKFCNSLEFKSSLRHQYWLGSFDDHFKKRSYTKSFRNMLSIDNNTEKILDSYLSNKNLLDWETHLYQDMRFYLQDDMLVKVDRASMANSLEVRVPFLDHNIVEFMAQSPKNIKYPNITSKYILKKLAKKYLPQKIINRSKKGFGIPLAKWFCNHLKDDLIDIIHNSDSFINSIFNKKDNILLMDAHFDKKVDHRKKLWSLFVLENWSKQRDITL